MEFLSNSNVQFYLAAYLVGGIPFGLLLARRFAGLDISQEGSRSIGATNVLRVVKEKNPPLAKKLAIATVALDFLKGIIVLLAATLMQMPTATLWGVAILAVVGHCFSPYLRFEGGKGVATAAGVLLYMLPLETLIAAGVWFGTGKLIKISSLASLAGLGTLIGASFVLHYDMPEIDTHAPLFIIAFLIVYKHLPNIMRLVRGEEQKVVS